MKRTDYHGGAFEENDCRKLLKNIDKLRVVCSQNDFFINVFEAFNDVLASCFGTQLADDFEEKIELFSTCYLKLNISVTPKVHAVMHHVSEF